MVDVLKTLDIDYLAMNCASSFRGLHEAILNHGKNKPEILTCPHEEIAVAMGHGYAKMEGKPLAMICHGVVGMYLQAMANRHGRGIDDVEIGTTIKDPNVDFAAVARGFGVYGEGPIEDPKELGPALQRALAVVKRGEPALIDVITDQR
jgi:thiamine pyrophosphate-dependent acetolactate synthase large subunit-like protein